MNEKAFLDECQRLQNDYLCGMSAEKSRALMDHLLFLETEEERALTEQLGTGLRIGWQNARFALELRYCLPPDGSTLGTWLFTERFRSYNDDFVTRAWAGVSKEQNEKVKRLLCESHRPDRRFLFFHPIDEIFPNVRTLDPYTDAWTWDASTSRPKPDN